jgi:hypothetical protein
MKNFLVIKIAVSTLMLVFSTILHTQPYRLEFNKTVHDFGDIKLNSGSHSYTFTFKNINKQPIVIQTVISSCGCTSPEWTKSPVLQGDNGEIKVTFLNNQGPYPFDKSLIVYITGETMPLKLRVRGVVKEEKMDVISLTDSSLPSVDTSSIDFGRISEGIEIAARFRIKNIGKNNLIINGVGINYHKSTTKYTSVIAPGNSGIIEVRIDTKGESGEKGYIFSVFTNSPSIPEVILIVTADIHCSNIQ